MQRRTGPPGSSSTSGISSTVSSRKVSSTSTTVGAGISPPPIGSTLRSSNTRRTIKGNGNNSGFSIWTMVFGGMLLMACTSWFLFPSTVSIVEEEALTRGQFLAKKAIEAEHRMEDWFHQEQQVLPPNPSANDEGSWNKRTSDEATAAMLAQGGSWVEGEKKLKAKLKKLVERQEKGLDLGVPVLTRYLGEDVPAWVGEGVDQVQWQATVDAKYAEMRKEEEEWQKRMKQMLKQRVMQRKEAIGITTAF